MTMHTVGYETSGSNAALAAITPIPDGTVVISGNDIRVPADLKNICWTAGQINSAAATLRAQLTSPSLRAQIPFDISPIRNGLTFGSLPPVMRMWDTPLPLVGLESLDFQVQNGAAVMNRGFLSFCDGPIKPVTGNIYSIRFTLAATLATATWANSQITFQSVLPYGTWMCVGARVWSANACAFRMFPIGAAYRPGGLAGSTESDQEWLDWRYGNIGNWFQFNSTTPPTVDVMGITDTAQVGILDLIKVS
jgi:hypothetical protein